MIDPETTSIDEGTPCANCGAPLLEDWLFCAACGAPKTAGEADAPELAETTE